MEDYVGNTSHDIVPLESGHISCCPPYCIGSVSLITAAQWQYIHFAVSASHMDMLRLASQGGTGKD